jgi:hypothetical protein
VSRGPTAPAKFGVNTEIKPLKSLPVFHVTSARATGYRKRRTPNLASQRRVWGKHPPRYIAKLQFRYGARLTRTFLERRLRDADGLA